MKRAAIYARYSSDRQSERSIEDQVALCTRHAAGKGWLVVGVFQDAALSGSVMANRPGLNAALALASAGGYDVLLAEDEDRLARNLEHQAHVFNRLRDLGVAIATLHSDAIGILEVGLKGVMNELYLEALSAKTKRGMASNAEKGLATGSRLYGYRTAPGGAIEIVEDQAETVRRICRAYAAGVTPRDIAAQLNREGVPSPRGGAWNASTINGSRQRGNGILHSEIYAGTKTFGRVVEKKNRATGRRRVVCAPPAAWKRVEVPHLRIVDPETWAAVRARKDRETEYRPHQLVQHKGLLSGLLKCRCGHGYTVYNRDRLACAGAREKGPQICTNKRLVKRGDVERRVIDGLRTQLLAPDLVRAYVAEYREHTRRTQADAARKIAPLQQKLAVADRRFRRLVDDLADTERGSAAAEAVKARMRELELEMATVSAQLQVEEQNAARHEAGPIALHPHAAEQYRQRVEQLHQVLARAAAAPPTEALAADELQLIRSLIDRIEILPRTPDRGSPFDIILHGRLAAILSGADIPDAGRGKLVVGGECSQPPTWGPGLLRLAV